MVVSGVCVVVLLLSIQAIVPGVVPGVTGRQPGFKTRITNHGLNYANKVAMTALNQYMSRAKIPDESGSSHDIHWSVSGMRVTGFRAPSSNIKLNPGKGLTWAGSGAGVSLHGDFHYKKWFVRGSGSFDISVSNLRFSVSILLGVDSGGRPKISAGPCSSSIGGLSVHFHGGASWFYNLFSHLIADKLKDSLNSQMCKLIRSQIDGDAEKQLMKLPVTVVLAKVFLLDYRLTGSPQFTATYMETMHKGEVYWRQASHPECPLLPPALPAPRDSSKMLYLWLSDYVFNTLGYVAQQHAFLQYNLTRNDLPVGSRGALNTTCTSVKCIGNLIPQIGQRYPDSVVELDMVSTLAPRMAIKKGVIGVTCQGQIKMEALTPKRTRAYLLTLNASMSATAEIKIQNEVMYAKVDQLKFDLTVLHSAIGPVQGVALQFVIDEALKMVLLPKLNALGARGFPLPVTKGIRFLNTNLTLDQGAIVIGTDISYQPKDASETTLPYNTADQATTLSGQGHDGKPDVMALTNGKRLQEPEVLNSVQREEIPNTWQKYVLKYRPSGKKLAQRVFQL